jgi:hypothetical protein
MLKFYSSAFGVEFHEVEVGGLRSQFGELNGITLKLVPIRDSADFKGFPVHQPGFIVSNIDEVIALAVKYGGKPEGSVVRDGRRLQGAVRDPDGNSIELYEAR